MKNEKLHNYKIRKKPALIAGFFIGNVNGFY